MYAYNELIETQNSFAPYEDQNIKFDLDPVQDQSGPIDWLTNQAANYPMQSEVVPVATPINDTPAPPVVVENVDQGTAAVFAPEPEKKTNLLLIGGVLVGLYLLLK